MSAVNYILLCRERRLYVSRIGTGAKVTGSESSRERKYQAAKVPPMVLSLLGAKVRGNESSIIPDADKTARRENMPKIAPIQRENKLQTS